MILVALTWFCYLMGLGLNVWMRAKAVVDSPLSGITSYKMFFEKHAPLLAIKFFASCMLLLVGFQSPAFSTVVEIIGKTVGEVANVGFAGLAGLGVDSALDKILPMLIKQLRIEIPPNGGAPGGTP